MKKIWLVFCVMFLSLSGCAKKEVYTFPTSYMIQTENYFDYQSGLECSAFSSAYLLRHYGEEAEGLILFETYPNKIDGGWGVYPEGIVNFFEGKGFDAEFETDASVEEVKAEIAKGNPVIVFIHVEEPYDSPHATHYVPVVGYDETYFYFAESLEYLANEKDVEGVVYNRKTEISKFEKLWVNIDECWDKPYFKITAPEAV